MSTSTPGARPGCAGAPAAIEAFRAAKEWMADNGLQFDEQVG
jgi:hypothetical protein